MTMTAPTVTRSRPAAGACSDLPLATVLVLVAAGAVLVSGWVHFSLYFRGGYRGIAPESFGGITISRAFALNAIGALVIAEALVLSLRWPRLSIPASLAGIGF